MRRVQCGVCRYGGLRGAAWSGGFSRPDAPHGSPWICCRRSITPGSLAFTGGRLRCVSGARGSARGWPVQRRAGAFYWTPLGELDDTRRGRGRGDRQTLQGAAWRMRRHRLPGDRLVQAAILTAADAPLAAADARARAVSRRRSAWPTSIDTTRPAPRVSRPGTNTPARTPWAP